MFDFLHWPWAAHLTGTTLTVVVCSVFGSLLATNDCMPPVGLKVATSCVNYEQQMHASYPPVVCGNPQLTQVCAQIFVFLIIPIGFDPQQQEASGSPTPKRPRGRPKGSKNKPSSIASRGKVSMSRWYCRGGSCAQNHRQICICLPVLWVHTLTITCCYWCLWFHKEHSHLLLHTVLYRGSLFKASHGINDCYTLF